MREYLTIQEYIRMRTERPAYMVDDVIHNDPHVYERGVTTSVLRSGVDGPHAGLADRLCNVNGRLYE